MPLGTRADSCVRRENARNPGRASEARTSALTRFSEKQRAGRRRFQQRTHRTRPLRTRRATVEREATEGNGRMKKSKVETAKTRQRIVEVAAKELRRNGIQQTGVAEVMAAAGLTQGGFYRHFDSKDQLVAEACAASMSDLVQAAEAAVHGGDDAFLLHLENFLSCKNRDNWLAGCPLVFLGSELARADKVTRRAVSQGYRDLVEVVAKQSRTEDVASARAEAIFTLAAMIGAVTLSRIVDDPEFSVQILDETKKCLARVRAKPATRASRAAGRPVPE
jgi:TetR/AcrR family transcriptional regulator, transcriptional repressor for nem operon